MIPLATVAILASAALPLVAYGFLLRPARQSSARDRSASEAEREEAARLRDEAREKLAAATRAEDRLRAREDALDARRAATDARESETFALSRAAVEKDGLVERRLRDVEDELARVAHLDKAKARDLYLERIEGEFREAGAQRAKEVEAARCGR